jgi:hypothetical protein
VTEESFVIANAATAEYFDEIPDYLFVSDLLNGEPVHKHREALARSGSELKRGLNEGKRIVSDGKKSECDGKANEYDGERSQVIAKKARLTIEEVGEQQRVKKMEKQERLVAMREKLAELRKKKECAVCAVKGEARIDHAMNNVECPVLRRGCMTCLGEDHQSVWHRETKKWLVKTSEGCMMCFLPARMAREEHKRKQGGGFNDKFTRCNVGEEYNGLRQICLALYYSGREVEGVGRCANVNEFASRMMKAEVVLDVFERVMKEIGM